MLQVKCLALFGVKEKQRVILSSSPFCALKTSCSRNRPVFPKDQFRVAEESKAGRLTYSWWLT